MIIPNFFWNVIKAMFQTTNQLYNFQHFQTNPYEWNGCPGHGLLIQPKGNPRTADRRNGHPILVYLEVQWIIVSSFPHWSGILGRGIPYFWTNPSMIWRQFASISLLPFPVYTRCGWLYTLLCFLQTYFGKLTIYQAWQKKSLSGSPSKLCSPCLRSASLVAAVGSSTRSHRFWLCCNNQCLLLSKLITGPSPSMDIAWKAPGAPQVTMQ